jgi:hypothetical protein
MNSLFICNLPEYAKEISSHYLLDALVRITAAAHRPNYERDVADVMHGQGKRSRLSEAYFKPVLEAQACQVHSLLEE